METRSAGMIPMILSPAESGKDARELNKILPGIVASARKDINDRLGIEDAFMVRVKSFTKRTAYLGLYRSGTQFTSMPVFWINEHLPSMITPEDTLAGISLAIAVRHTIIHEYGHVIAEWAQLRCAELNHLITAYFNHEEDFAERFIGYVESNFESDVFEPIVALYRGNAFTAG